MFWNRIGVLIGVIAGGGTALALDPSITWPMEEQRGVWVHEFRLCVQSQVEQGTPIEEARQSCSPVY